MGSLKVFLRVFLILFFVASMSTSLLMPPTGAATPTPKIKWTPCYRELGFPFECGTVHVPLDYDNPGLATVVISLVRLPATDPAHKIGTLFFNPGGPGGSGVDFILGAGPYLYTDELRARFDIVGFDPRGIARSTALRCYGNYKQWMYYPFVFPVNPAEEMLWQQADDALAGQCDQRGSKLYDHMSTADAARDLDLLREAVGDAKLNYIGYSYGTYLGMTYVTLFPNKVRAVVLDSNLDPIAWSTGKAGESATLPFSTRLKSAAGAQATLNEFFRLCDEGVSPFSGNTANRFATMCAKLKAAPLLITTPEGLSYYFTYADLIGNVWGAMYNSASWPDLADFLAGLEAALPSTELGALLYKLWNTQGFINKRGFPHYYNYMEGFPAIACPDSDNPNNFAAWSAAATKSEQEDGYFGPAWTWISSVCLPWGGAKEDRYVGPWKHATSYPVLVANNLYDPATRYEGALKVHDLLTNSSLLTVHGWGHGTFWESVQADQAVSDYVVYGTLPAPGTVYDQDWVPFSTGSVAGSSFGKRMEARALLIPQIVPDAVRSTVKVKNQN